MMKKILSLLLMLSLCALAVPAAAETADLTGTWYISTAHEGETEVQVVDSDAIVLTVNEDGTFVLAANAVGAEATGTWALDGDQLVLTNTDDGQTTEFTVTDDGLTFQMNTSTLVMSRTPQEPVALPAAVPADDAAAFNGTWVPHAQVVMGLYSVLSEEEAAASGALQIEDGTINLLGYTEEGTPYVGATYETAFADGALTYTDDTFFSTVTTIPLREDGTLFYHSVISMEEASMETLLIYAPAEAAEEVPAA